MNGWMDQIESFNHAAIADFPNVIEQYRLNPDIDTNHFSKLKAYIYYISDTFHSVSS